MPEQTADEWEIPAVIQELIDAVPRVVLLRGVEALEASSLQVEACAPILEVIGVSATRAVGGRELIDDIHRALEVRVGEHRDGTHGAGTLRVVVLADGYVSRAEVDAKSIAD